MNQETQKLFCGHHQGVMFYMHKCLKTFCVECYDARGTCPSCEIPLMEQDFISTNIQVICEHDNCSTPAAYRCDCLELALCELHLLSVHRKIIASKRCIPSFIENVNADASCVKCNKFIATHMNDVTGEYLCEKCNKEHASSNSVPLEASNISENLERFHSTIKKNLETCSRKLEDFYANIAKEEATFHENISIIKNEFTKLQLENKSKADSFKEAINRGESFLSSLMDQDHVHSVRYLIEANMLNKKVVQAKLESWIKEFLESLVVPQLIKFSFDIHESRSLMSIRKVIDHDAMVQTRCDAHHGSQRPMSTENILALSINMLADQLPHTHDCGNLDCYCQYINKKRPHDSVNQHQAKKRCPPVGPDPFESHDSDESEHEDEHDWDTVYTEVYTEDSFEAMKTIAPKTSSASESSLIRFHDNNEVTVKVTSLRCPLWFFLEKPEMVKKREEILSELNKPEAGLIQKLSIRPHERVVIQDKLGYGPRMKRAFVRSYNQERGTWLVKLLDYGKDINISSDNVFTIPSEFHDIEETCFKASLIGVKPRSNFCFVQELERNATSYINKYLKPSSGRVNVIREYQTTNDSTFCRVSSFMNGKKMDWAKELIEANLALPIESESNCFLANEDYCYLAHYYGKCFPGCERVHKCPYCSCNHYLKNCVAFRRELKEKEGQVQVQK